MGFEMLYDIKSKHDKGFLSTCDLDVIKDSNGNKQLKCINYWLGKVITFFAGPQHTINILDQVIQDTAQVLRNESTSPTIEELENVKGNLNSIILKYAMNPSAKTVDSLMRKKLNNINLKIVQCDEKIKNNISKLFEDCNNFIHKDPRDKIIIDDYFYNYKNLYSIIKELDKFKKSEDIENQLKKVNEKLLELQKDFYIVNPGKRLFICENDFFISNEASFIRQSIVEQARAHSWKDNSPSFIQAPKALDGFLKNPKKFKIDEDNFQDLLAFSHEFEMPILKEKCDQFLLGQIDVLEIKEEKLLGDFYELATIYELPKSSKQLLDLPLSRFPKSHQAEIQKQKKAPPAFKKNSTSEMIERLVSTKIGSDVQLKVGEEILHVDSRALRNLSRGEKEIELKDISPQAVKSLIEYAYYGAINTISSQVLAELWMYTSNNAIIIPEFKQYLAKNLLDYISIKEMGLVIDSLDPNKYGEFVKVLLKTLEEYTGFSLKLNNEGNIDVILQQDITPQPEIFQLIEDFSSRIKNLKVTNDFIATADSLKSFLLKCNKVESLDIDYDFKVGLRLMIASLPSIKKLHLNINKTENFKNFTPNFHLTHLESFTYSGKDYLELSNLLDQDTLSDLIELKIPHMQNADTVNYFLDQCSSLETLEIYANSSNVNSVFAKAQELKQLNVVGGNGEKFLGNKEVVNYLRNYSRNNIDLPTLFIQPSCKKIEAKISGIGLTSSKLEKASSNSREKAIALEGKLNDQKTSDDTSQKAADALLEYMNSGSIVTISSEVLAELWEYTLAMEPELANLKKYLNNRLLDYIPLDQMGKAINELDLEKQGDFVKVLLTFLEAHTGFSLKLNNGRIEVILRQNVEKQPKFFQFIDGFSSRIKDLKITRDFSATTDSLKPFLSHCKNVESLDIDYDFPGGLQMMIASLPSIKKLHLNINNTENYKDFSPNIHLQNLESFTYSGKDYLKLSNLLDQDTLTRLNELKIPHIQKADTVNYFLDQCPSLETLEIYANSSNVNSVFAKAQKLKCLNIVGGERNHFIGKEVLNYARNNTQLLELNLGPSCTNLDNSQLLKLKVDIKERQTIRSS